MHPERQRRRLGETLGVGRLRKHHGRVVDADPAAVRQVAGEFALAASDVEYRHEPLADQATGNMLVDVAREGVAAEDRARRPEACRIAVVVGRHRTGGHLLGHGAIVPPDWAGWFGCD